MKTSTFQLRPSMTLTIEQIDQDTWRFTQRDSGSAVASATVQGIEMADCLAYGYESSYSVDPSPGILLPIADEEEA